MDKGMFKVFTALLFTLLLYGAKQVCAQKIVLKNDQNCYIADHPLFLTDDKNNLGPGMLSDRVFKRSEFPVLSLGATTASVWIKMVLVNRSNIKNWFIQIDSPPVLQSAEVYRQEAGHLVKIYSSRADKIKTRADIRVNNLLIPLVIPAGTEAEYYIRANSNNILRLPIKILSLKCATEVGYLTSLFNGITFGMLMAFAIYNLFVYLLTREKPYLHYLGYIFFWSLNLFFYNGFLTDIFPGLIWLNSAATIIAMASILSIIFTNSFLQTKKYSPFFYKIRWLMVSLSLVILFTDIFWKGAYAFIMVQYCMYPFFIYWFGAGVQSLRNGYKPALYFIMGFGCLMLGNALYNLKDLNVIQDNLFTRTSMHWGTLLETLVLSFALASRLNFYRKQKEQLQIKLIDEKRNFLKELLQRQEQEKKRVAMELHDNIGQQLILIKNRFWRLHQLSEDRFKTIVMKSVSHVADIMAEVRSILHRLRPYQMDLLGLNQSIHGLMAEVFTDYKTNDDDDISSLFNADESMHIFRIIQLLADDIQVSAGSASVYYSAHRLSGTVEFVFGIDGLQDPPGSFPGINNRLELLNGCIDVYGIQDTTFVKISIPYSSKK